MPSSFSFSLRFERQFPGENLNVWGERLSNTLARVDDAIAGYVSIPLTGNYALSTSNDNAAPDEARRAHLRFTGALTVNTTITIPGVSKSYWICNDTNVPLVFTTGAGATVMVDAGDELPLWCDGTHVRTITFGNLPVKDYIGAISASAGAVPGLPGNAGKYLYTDAVSAYWRQPQSSDLGDYETAIKGLAIAFAVAL